MRVLAISHQANAGPGVFADEIHARGATLDRWLVPAGAPAPAEPAGYDAVMTFGGSMHADEEERHPWLREEKALLGDLLDRGVPLLGVCLGSQLVAEAAGAPAERASKPEIGWLEVELTAEGVADPLLAPLAPRFGAFQWHSYRSPLPPGAVALARSAASLQGFRAGARAWGIQFHAEVTEGDALGWVARHERDPAAAGVNPEELKASIAARMQAWNELGRALCGRFLDLAAVR